MSRSERRASSVSSHEWSTELRNWLLANRLREIGDENTALNEDEMTTATPTAVERIAWLEERVREHESASQAEGRGFEPRRPLQESAADRRY
jgi:hypothetical protein